MLRHCFREGAVIQSHMEALFQRRCSDTVSCEGIVLEKVQWYNLIWKHCSREGAVVQSHIVALF